MILHHIKDSMRMVVSCKKPKQSTKVPFLKITSANCRFIQIQINFINPPKKGNLLAADMRNAAHM